MRTILTILFAIFLFLFFHSQHTAWPEVLVYPYLLNNGLLPYKDLIQPYTPGFLWFLQGVTQVFGYTPQVSQLVTLILASLNIGLSYFISKSLWKKNEYASLLSVLFYLLWFFYFEGNGLWFELLITPLVLLAFWFFYTFFFVKNQEKYFILGSFCLALCFIVKQSSLWMIMAVGAYTLFFYKTTFFNKLKLCGYFSLLIIFIVGLSFIPAILGGYLNDYFYWAFRYVFLELPFHSDYQEAPQIAQMLKLGIPLLAIAPFVFFKKDMQVKIFILFFLAATFMFALPRWGLFHLAPFLAILSLTVPKIEGLWSKNLYKMVALVIICLWLVVVFRQHARFWDKPVRFFEPEIYSASERLKKLKVTDFMVFNSADQLYVLNSTRPSVAPYVQNFASFMEIQNVQERVVEDLEKKKTQYIIFSPFSGKGGQEAGDYRPGKLSDYIDMNYYLKEQITGNIWLLERK